MLKYIVMAPRAAQGWASSFLCLDTACREGLESKAGGGEGAGLEIPLACETLCRMKEIVNSQNFLPAISPA